VSSAELQGVLWGARPQAWAAQEALSAPVYEEGIRLAGIGEGSRVLDVGCGAGTFLGLAAGRGAVVHGLDASAALLELAQARVPGADLRLGDLQELPYDDGSFDAVTGFSSFQFAGDVTAALREAGRVARPGAPVVIQVWGRPERCETLAAMRALSAVAPSSGGERAPLWSAGMLEVFAAGAGLVPREAVDLVSAFEYPDAATAVAGMLASGGGARVIRAAGEEAARAALLGALPPYRTAAGGYRFENEWHFLVAAAPG
jgi:SAM-dependent methyltransferase